MAMHFLLQPSKALPGGAFRRAKYACNAARTGVTTLATQDVAQVTCKRCLAMPSYQKAKQEAAK